MIYVYLNVGFAATTKDTAVASEKARKHFIQLLEEDCDEDLFLREEEEED